jgi:hypothetical protein
LTQPTIGNGGKFAAVPSGSSAYHPDTVAVAVGVRVGVGVCVGVLVAVRVAVMVGVDVLVGVGVAAQANSIQTDPGVTPDGARCE